MEVFFDPTKDRGIISDIDRISERFPGRNFRILKKYIDARHGKLKLCYRLEEYDEAKSEEELEALRKEAMPYMDLISPALTASSKPPVVVGFGPAGMFAALVLATYGLRPVVIERGQDIPKRVSDCEDFRQGIKDLNPGSNILFGAGGAGTFSDGKLYTGISSGIKGYVSLVFRDNGAPDDILYDSHPHIGTDRLRDVISNIRKKIEGLGGQILFATEFIGVESNNGRVAQVKVRSSGEDKVIQTDCVILGIGHSATDTMRSLYNDGVAMESKSFSVGVRIEHRRRDIDIAQYGVDTKDLPNITAADYKLAVDTVTGRKLYTFCMCPGGEVVASSAFPGHIVTNGMSYRARDLDNSNAALLVPVSSEDYGLGVFAGLDFRERLEIRAFELAGSSDRAPFMTYGELLSGKLSGALDLKVRPSYRPGIAHCDLRQLFPDYVTDTIVDGIRLMGRKIKGFDSPDAVLTAPETGSSSPVRILRDRESYESISIKGLYPAGEGAGYAGGIVSSAVDGINCANAYVSTLLH